MGGPYGITYADRPFLSNSRRALMAAEFSRDRAKFQPVHEAIFSSYFSHGLDIGNFEVLSHIARSAGLDPGELKSAVENNTYAPRLVQAQRQAAEAGVTGVPTFVIAGAKTIVGAQPIDVFRKAIASIKRSRP